MTRDRCQAAARSLNYEYFGLAGGNKCWFGNSLPTAMRFGVRYACNRPCNGNSGQICGGADLSLFSLYRTDRCGAGARVLANVTILAPWIAAVTWAVTGGGCR
jgi:hypothetical protein